MMDLTDDVIDALKSNSSVSGLVTGRVFWVRPGGEGPYPVPFITVAESENAPAEFADDMEMTSQIGVQIGIFSKGKISDLKTAINNVMVRNGFARSSSGYDEYLPELKLYFKTMNYTIQKEVSA